MFWLTSMLMDIFPIRQQLTPSAHEPVTTKMQNDEERKKLIPGLKQKPQGRQNVCEILKTICLKKGGLLHK